MWIVTIHNVIEWVWEFAHSIVTQRTSLPAPLIVPVHVRKAHPMTTAVSPGTWMCKQAS